MDIPTRNDCPSQPSHHLHLLLAERGSAILPEAGNADGRVTLTDAMLGVAALAVCFALARASLAIGFVALAVVIPALARTHVVMVRGRGLGSPTNVGTWVVAFVSSTIRIALILGLVSVILATTLAIGFRPTVLSPIASVLLSFTILGVPLTLLALAYLVPRLLLVRDPG